MFHNLYYSYVAMSAESVITNNRYLCTCVRVCVCVEGGGQELKIWDPPPLSSLDAYRRAITKQPNWS